MLFRRKEKEIDPKERAMWGDLTGLGMVFPIAITLGFFLGRYLGKLLGFPLTGILLGLGFGAATGFWELYKTTKRLDRYDSNNPPPKDGGDGPHA